MTNDTNPNNATVQKDQTDASSREDRIGAAYAAIAKTLKGLSNSETTEVLRALAGANGLQVVFPGAAVRQQPSKPAPKGKGKEKAEGAPKGGSVPNPINKDPKVLKQKGLLKEITAKVKEAAAKNGGPLPAEHTLLQEKKECEELLRSFRSGEGSSKD